MSYKGYSFNLHKEDDKELIDWLSNKKVTKTIKIALYNQMRADSGAAPDIELLSAIKKIVESNSNNNESIVAEKNEESIKKDDDKKLLSDEDADDFEKIFDI